MNIDIALLSQSLTTQIGFIIDGEISAEELSEQQFALIEHLNPHVNAFLSLDESVLDEVGDAMGPFYGLGIPVKDNIAVTDLPLTHGLSARIETYPDEDAFAVSLLKDAGASINGKLNMQAGGLGADGSNPYFGNSNNPYHFDHVCGGSSSGSAAAVASCLAAVSIGSDTMGSVRIPASYCGVFGFKPSRGAISDSGLSTCVASFDSIGMFSRSVEDISLLLDVMSAQDSQQTFEQCLSDEREYARKVKLLVPSDLAALGVEQSVITDFNNNIAVFEQLGCDIATADFAELKLIETRKAAFLLCCKGLIEHQDDWLNDAFPEHLRTSLHYAQQADEEKLLSATACINVLIEKTAALMEEVDAVLLPTTPQRAFRQDEEAPVNQADLTYLANVAGLPAISLPMKTDNPLPAGMQLIGKQGDDFSLLSLCELWQQQSQYEYQLPTAIEQALSL